MKTYKSLVGEVSAIYKTKDRPKVKISSSEDAYKELIGIWDKDIIEYREQFGVLLLNRANNTLGFEILFSGGVSGTVADLKNILQLALVANASNIIVAHNHPSGNIKPSDADIQMTRRLKDACKIMDIKLLDSMILTKDSFTSLADEGYM